MAETYTSLEDPRDWRGVPITKGATVIYGAPLGRSIALVEGVVESFTKSGRVNVRIVRRAYGFTYSDSKPVVHVGQDRLTVVESLPEPLMPTEAEKQALRDAEHAERDRVRATHAEFEAAPEERTSYGALRYTTPGPCLVCGCAYRDSYKQECTGVETS